jgi:hypothetical protein
MPTLYSYCIPGDAGAAPNPYGGMCTLAICKPAIRRTAQVGDWVVGVGAKHAADGKDHSGKVVYAMRVTEKLAFEKYDKKYPFKRPKRDRKDRTRWLGDNIYDFSRPDPLTKKPPRQRWGVHAQEDIKTDLGGKFVLISSEFVYFGSQPKPLPKHLHPIIKQGPGNKAAANDPYVESFLEWLKSLPVKWNKPLHDPQVWPFGDEDETCVSACERGKEAEEDERLGCEG